MGQKAVLAVTSSAEAGGALVPDWVLAEVGLDLAQPETSRAAMAIALTEHRRRKVRMNPPES
jgi:hypothetical protein